MEDSPTNVKKDFVGLLALKFGLVVYIYFLVMISLFLVLALGKAFFDLMLYLVLNQ